MASRMPAYSRAPVGNLPDIDEATVPFSSLFAHTFDRATVEAMVPLADKSIFVAQNGRRYVFASLPDEGENRENGNQSQSRTGNDSVPSPPAIAASPNQANLPRRDSSTLSNSPIRRRPVSNAASHQYVHGGKPSDEKTKAVPEPKVPTDDVTGMMAHLNISRFSATPFFAHSDGGVLAAETLTDLDPVPRLPIPQSPTSPIRQSPPSQSPTSMLSLPPSYRGSSYSAQTYTETTYAPQLPVQSTQSASYNYDCYSSTGVQQEAGRQISIPSLPNESTPRTPANPTNSMLISPLTPQTQSGYFQAHVSANFASIPYQPSIPHQTSSTIPYPSNPQGEARRSSGGSYRSAPLDSPNTQANYLYSVDHSHGETHYDTRTPVVVIGAPLGTQTASNSSASDGISTTRDGVMPGEDLLYDKPVKITESLSTPFQEGWLKVFRNMLSNDLRFHSRVGNCAETYWMKGVNAQMVPVYAYDQRFPNVVYMRDNDRDRDSDRRNGSIPMQGSGLPSYVYQFPNIQELSQFQLRLTGEKVCLDISSVRLVKLKKMSSSSIENFSSVRVQIWHEEEVRTGPQADVASFLTAGTALSGPSRDRLVPKSSRLLVFLGRLEEYITVFVTDDIEVIAHGQDTVKIKARKGRLFSHNGGRWPGVKAHRECKKGSEPAGFDISGQPIDPDRLASFDLYETFEIEFESSPSQANFMRKWHEALRERRLQRAALEDIQDGMRQATFSGKTARRLW